MCYLGHSHGSCFTGNIYSIMECTLRKRRNIDYHKLNQGMEQHKSEDELDLAADVEGERALCGSFDEDEELDYEEHVRNENSEIEEREVHMDSDEAESEEELEDEEVAQCICTRNLDKLKKILKKRENDCKQLKKEMEKKKLHEKQECKMPELVSKIRKVTKTKRTLQRSLASSKQNSPSHSPKVQKYRVKGKPPTRKKDIRVVQQKEKPREERSEYNDLLSTMLKLKQGSTDYNEIVANAMNAMDNLLTLK